jgi:SAM-dependent methyltransferase
VDRSSRNRLNDRHLSRFGGDTLFERLGRSVCHAGCLPRKEFFEAWETVRRVRRRFRGGRVVDLACGHGLLAYTLLLLDDSSPEALAVDLHVPESAGALAAALEETWPRLRGRVRFEQRGIEQIPLTPNDLVVSVHACGKLTDLVLDRAIDSGARVAVLPCCHNLDDGDMGGLQGWMGGPMAVDATRAARLRSQGYKVYTQTIPVDITPKNRLLLAEPAS